MSGESKGADGLIDLACEDFGGAAISCNDEFFAEKENLLRARAAEWREHEYTDRGKWMDGWETRRRREPGHDFCVIRLGLPGTPRRLVVDTAFFRGNFPSECSLDACELPTHLDLGASPEWVELLPRSPLKGDSRNEFALSEAGRGSGAHGAAAGAVHGAAGGAGLHGAAAGRRFTHVRLNIFPDGGVARLRVLGEVVPDFARLTVFGGAIDLAALENGGRSLVCSDMFFGSRHNLIAPGRARTMGEGWETRRRRGPGHDWNIVQLGAPGTLRRIEVDTTHFKGNAPGRCSIDACDAQGATVAMLTGEGAPGVEWRVLLPESKTQPHTRHFFDRDLRSIGRVTHVRLNVFPDGGVARLRAYGEPEIEDGRALSLARLNKLPRAEALNTMRGFCGSLRWAEAMADAQPFEDTAALLRLADRAFWKLSEADWLEAFAAHPRIGDKAAGAAEREEQSGVAGASDETLAELAQANRDYLERHGFVFLICATGRSAAEMLEALRARLGRSRAQEIRTAAEEQSKILRLRLEKWLDT